VPTIRATVACAIRMRPYLGALLVLLGCSLLALDGTRWDVVLASFPGSGHGLHASEVIGFGVAAVGVAVLWTGRVQTVVVRFRRQGEIVDTWREERSEAWCVGGPYDSPKYGPCVIVAISKSTSPPAVTVESVSSR
jgi:hypothetical protein